MRMLFVDNCAWDVLYKHSINLHTELGDLFEILVNGYGEVEIPLHPIADKPGLAAFIRDTLSKSPKGGVRKTFGFSSKFNDKSDPNTGGFGSSMFMTKERQANVNHYKQMRPIGGKQGNKIKGSGLPANLTDAHYAALANEHPVLTANIDDFRDSPYVIDVLAWSRDKHRLSLRSYVIDTLRNRRFIFNNL